jgi:propanol-preferring alcohol dehydrogenase
MPDTMKAAVVHEFGQPLSIEEMPRPEPGPDEILVQVQASGVCHTDLHAADGDWPVKPKLPLVPGHEGVGYVAAAGTNVTTVREGDAVGVPWLYSACGTCQHCRGGWETLCEAQENAGYSVDGGYAEYVLADPEYVGVLPDDVDFTSMAPILCAGVTVYKGLKMTGVRPGQWVLISGIGGLGHLAVQYAKAMGMRVAAVDIQENKLSLAEDLGADATVNASTDHPGDTLRTQIGGVHGALVTAVSTPAFRQALDALRRGGTLVLNGLPPGDFPLPIFETVLNGITVRGSIVGTRNDLQEAIDFAADGAVHTHVDATEPLDGINDIFDRMKAGSITGRVVLDMANGAANGTAG